MKNIKEIRVNWNIPFITQMVDIPNYQNEGFLSMQDAMHWQERGCGIASLRMIIKGMTNISTLQGKLIYKGVLNNAYSPKGWIHQGIAELGKIYGIEGTSYRNKDYSSLLYKIDNNEPCIVSVTVCFNGGKENSNGGIYQKGGHLIVLIGYVIDIDTSEIVNFIVHHPSSMVGYNWENYYVSSFDFINSFSGNLKLRD